MRRSKNRVIAGVCGGVADKLDWPANRVRLIYVLLSIFTAIFPGLLTYIILWLVMPGPEDSSVMSLDHDGGSSPSG